MNVENRELSQKLIDSIDELRKSINTISVYDFNIYSSMELYYTIANKLNEVIKECYRYEVAVSEEVIKQNECLQYLLNEGLNAEVVKKIDNLVLDGTMDEIINHNVFNKLNSQIKENKNNLETLKTEKYLFFGDSYGEGYTPDGNVTSWCDQLKKIMKISDDNFYKFVKGGYGFTNNGFLELLNKSIVAINDKEKVKYIVIGGGYNDAKTYDKIGEKMSEFINICKENYPNAEIILAPFGWCVEGLTTGVHANQKIINLINMVLEYQKNAIENGCSYIDGIYSVLHRNRFFSSDYVHPNADGQYNIALAIANYLKGGSFSTVQYMNNENCFEGIELETGISSFTIMCSVVVDEKSTILNLLRGDINGTFNDITLNGSDILIGTVKNAAVHGYYHKISMNCGGVLRKTDNTYIDVNITFTIYDNKLYMKIVKINDAGDNFVTTSFNRISIYTIPSTISINSLIN